MKKLLVIMGAVAMLASAGYAAEWNFYGSARVETFYDSTERDATADVTDTRWEMDSGSRIGANVKVSDELTGRFEFGAGQSIGPEAVRTRLIYGEWNFGKGSLLVGQAYSPLYVFQSSQAWYDYGMAGLGEVYAGRKPQIRLTFGDFEVALQQPDLSYVIPAAPGYDYGSDTDSKLPAIAVKYKFANDTWGVILMGGYSTFKVAEKESVDSYMLGVGADVKLGSLWLAANVNGGQNQGNLTYIETISSIQDDSPAGYGYAYYDGANVLDNDALACSMVANYTLNDMFALEAGYGYQQTKMEIAGVNSKDKANTYYFQTPITVAPGVVVIPEIGVVDFKESGQTQTTYFGAAWRVSF